VQQDAEIQHYGEILYVRALYIKKKGKAIPVTGHEGP
jgi:hypothetical protein